MIDLLLAAALIHFQIGTVECWTYPRIYSICRDGNEYAMTWEVEGEIKIDDWHEENKV